MSRRNKDNIVKFSIQIFLISLLISSFVYESTGMTSALQTLEEGKLSIAAMQILSISYIAAITTALFISVYYFGGTLIGSEFIKNMRDSQQKEPSPDLVVVNPNATKELIDKMNLSVN